jgi:hypothetical protein
MLLAKSTTGTKDARSPAAQRAILDVCIALSGKGILPL